MYCGNGDSECLCGSLVSDVAEGAGVVGVRA